MSLPEVIIEFYGVPRLRAGKADLRVCADTVGSALRAVVHSCPTLSGLLTPDGRLAPHYLLSLDGERFLLDLGEALHPGARLLLLSADAGG